MISIEISRREPRLIAEVQACRAPPSCSPTLSVPHMCGWVSRDSLFSISRTHGMSAFRRGCMSSVFGQHANSYISAPFLTIIYNFLL